MPSVEETLASYLLQSEASSLKAPVLPFKPLQTTLRLTGKAHVAAGQADGALHTVSVLQAYQPDPLRDLNQGQGLSPEAIAVAELRHTTDLTPLGTKQTAAAISHSIAAIVLMEW